MLTYVNGYPVWTENGVVDVLRSLLECKQCGSVLHYRACVHVAGDSDRYCPICWSMLDLPVNVRLALLLTT